MIQVARRGLLQVDPVAFHRPAAQVLGRVGNQVGGSRAGFDARELCRYITRPALSDERIQVNAAGQVALRLKTPWRDGTTHLVLSPLDFMQRLAAGVPRPRLHLIRYHGVLAPNAKLRARVVPQGHACSGSGDR